MKRQLPKYVYAKLQGRYHYFERGGDRIRMQSKPGTDEFWQEYALLLKGKPAPVKPGKRTFRPLIRSYVASDRYTERAFDTRRNYQPALKLLDEKIGHLPVTAMQRKDVIALRDANAASFGNLCVKVVSVLMEHAIDIGWRADNPAKGVRKRKIPVENQLGRAPWPQHLLDAYREASPIGERARLIMELCLGTGQRIRDVQNMRWSDYDGEVIHVVQSKTKKKLAVPVTARLKEVLDATPKRTLYMLPNHAETGPLDYQGAIRAVSRVRRKIGAYSKGTDIHAWRHNAASELKSVGCTADQIQAVTGMTPAIQAVYTATVTQIDLAKKAQEKRK